MKSTAYSSHIEEIKEGVKKNDESDSENNYNKSISEGQKENETEREGFIRKSKNLKYSLNFDEDYEEEEENDTITNNI